MFRRVNKREERSSIYEVRFGVPLWAAEFACREVCMIFCFLAVLVVLYGGFCMAACVLVSFCACELYAQGKVCCGVLSSLGANVYCVEIVCF